MPKYIVEIRNPADDADRRLLEWSTIVDAPTTYGMSRDVFQRYYRSRYGDEGMHELAERLARVDAKGTSAWNDASWEDTIAFNRAGPDEARLDAAGIWAAYADAPE